MYEWIALGTITIGGLTAAALAVRLTRTESMLSENATYYEKDLVDFVDDLRQMVLADRVDSKEFRDEAVSQLRILRKSLQQAKHDLARNQEMLGYLRMKAQLELLEDSESESQANIAQGILEYVHMTTRSDLLDDKQ